MARLELRHNFRTLNAIINNHRKGIPISRLETHYSARRCVRNRLELLRRWRALRNGTYLTRQHLARRPRAFHRLRCGDRVHVWREEFDRIEEAMGILCSIFVTWNGLQYGYVRGQWWPILNNLENGFRYVH